MISAPLFYVAAVPAVMLLGLSKGGFSGVSALAMPLMVLVLPPVQAASIVLPILIVQDAFSLWAYWRRWDLYVLAAMFPGAIFGIVLGYCLAARVPPGAVALTVGLISVVFALRRLLRQAPASVPTRGLAHRLFGGVCGIGSGFTSMIAHAGGPPYQIFTLPLRLPREVFVGTQILLFALINWFKVPAYLALGQFTRETLLTSLALFPLAILSTWAGVLLVRRVSGARFYKIVDILLLLVGTKLVIDGVRVMV